MSQREDVLRILAEQPGGLTDAQLTAELRRTHPKVVHQTANALCRALAADGLIVRDAANGPIVNRLAVAAPVSAARRLRQQSAVALGGCRSGPGRRPAR